MILAIDVGNSQTVIGLFKSPTLAEDDSSVGLDMHCRISTNASLTADELRVTIGALLSENGRHWSDVDSFILACVVPRLKGSYEELCMSVTGRLPVVVGPGLKTGMPICYDSPHEVGADRIANSVAAVARLGAPVVVVDFGTATTLDVVDATGAYIGGVIAPGVETSAEALFSKAARLAVVDLVPPPCVIGTSTKCSVQSGLVLGEAVMIDGLVRLIWDEIGTETPVIATGGLAERMSHLCTTISHVDMDLTLVGLMLIYSRSKGVQ